MASVVDGVLLEDNDVSATIKSEGKIEITEQQEEKHEFQMSTRDQSFCISCLLVRSKQIVIIQHTDYCSGSD